MERLHGVPLTDLAAIRSITSADPEQALITALNTWFGSVLGCKTFHADVHAGAPPSSPLSPPPNPHLLTHTHMLAFTHVPPRFHSFSNSGACIHTQRTICLCSCTVTPFSLEAVVIEVSPVYVWAWLVINAGLHLASLWQNVTVTEVITAMRH